jgi:myo-inositol 2-dehydrogenase/D-chiro-inositol 1-dehydrogenase
MRAGFIGAGNMARVHATALRNVADVKIAGFFDTNQAAAQACAQDFGGTACRTQEELLDIADAVWVLTPPRAHRDPVVAAAEHGRAVFCEKPIATTLGDARAMVEAADRAQVPMMTGFNNRFRPQLLLVHDAVATGAIGQVLSCWSRRLGYSRHAPESDWRTSKDQLAGMTIQSCSHDIDMLRFIVGEITVVTGVIASSLPEVEGYDDNLSATLRFESGSIGTIQSSWSSHLGSGSRGVIGTNGSASVEGPDLWTFTHVRERYDPEGIEQISWYTPKVADDKGYIGEDQSFVRAVREGTQPGATGHDGLRALEVSLALLESARTGGSVDTRTLTA